MNKVQTPVFTFDENSPSFLKFRDELVHLSKDKTDFLITFKASDIEDAVSKPPHFELALEWFPSISAADLFVVAAEILKASGGVWIQTIQDYYDTTFPQWDFKVPVAKLYEIYLKHGGQ